MAKESLLYLEVNGTILNYKLDLNSLLTPHVYFKQIYVNLRFSKLSFGFQCSIPANFFLGIVCKVWIAPTGP